MSIRALARELYKAQQNFDRLEKACQSATLAEKDILEKELRMARKELTILRRMLDGEKESGGFRKKFTGFGSSKT